MTAKLTTVAAPTTAIVDQGIMEGKGARRMRTSSAAMSRIAAATNTVSVLILLCRIQCSPVPNTHAPPLSTTDIINNCLTRFARSSPSTSVRHGYAHSPCNDQREPMQGSDQAAILQKSRSLNTYFTVTCPHYHATSRAP